MEIILTMALGCVLGMAIAVAIVVRENFRLRNDNERLFGKVQKYEHSAIAARVAKNIRNRFSSDETNVESPRYLN